MSAFICGPDHFIALAVFATHRSYGRDLRVDPRYVTGLEKVDPRLPREEIASIYANILYAENVRSVLHRYPQDTLESAPGPIDKPESLAVTYKHCDHVKWTLKSVAILKLCDCLEYQSCETDDWQDTPAYRLLGAIRRAAIRQLPGYEDSPWDYEAA